MDDQKTTQELLGQLSGKAIETATVWTDANRRVLRELVEFSAVTAKEGVKLYAELQQSAVEALCESRAVARRWQGAWSGGATDPMHLYQKALMDSVDSVERALKFLEGHAQALARAAERVQTSAEETGKSIQETCTAAVTKMRDVCAQS